MVWNSLWVRKETVVEIMNNAHLIWFTWPCLVAQWKPCSGFHNHDCSSDSHCCWHGDLPCSRMWAKVYVKGSTQSSNLYTSDASESEQGKQKQECMFAARLVFSQPRKTLPPKVMGCRTQGRKCAEVSQSEHLSYCAGSAESLGWHCQHPFHNIIMSTFQRSPEPLRV